MKKTKKKWYNIPQMVGTLLFFLPPVGLYGIYKSDTILPKWKNTTYGALAFAFIGGVLLYVG